MAFNGSGTFVRLYNWANDKAANIKVRADRMDSEMDGMATGLSTCITKNGQTTVTANLPMANYRHTGVGNATSRTDYAAAGQVQDGSFNWVDGGGTADAITATYSPAVTSLVDGMELRVRATAANATTTPTFSPNGITAHTITKHGGSPLVAGDIPGDGYEMTLRYRLADTEWELLNPITTRAELGLATTDSPQFAGLKSGGGATTTEATSAQTNAGSGGFEIINYNTGTNAGINLRLTSDAVGSGTTDNRNHGIFVNVAAFGDMIYKKSSTRGGDARSGDSIFGVDPNNNFVLYKGMQTYAVATGSAPTYAAGKVYYDTTLSKLIVGGASAYETILSGTATSYQATPSNPAGTTSTVGVMMGLAGSITPTRTGKLLIIIGGHALNTNGGDLAKMQIRYGTGTAPSNGAALTGTAAGSQISAAQVTGSANAFSLNAIVSSLSISTAYWIDISLAASANTASVQNISISVVEI